MNLQVLHFFPDIEVQVVLRAGLICFSRFEV